MTRKYFGYARQHARRSFGGFQLEQDGPCFQIQPRGEHFYTLIKGEFFKNLLLALPRWLGSLVRRRTHSPRARQSSSSGAPGAHGGPGLEP